MKVLITGGRGFVGKNTVRTLLSHNYEIEAVHKCELNLVDTSPWRVVNHPIFRTCTLTGAHGVAEYLKWKKINAIVHLAGNVGGIGYNQDNQGKLGFENLQMGMNILEAARLSNINKVVMLGTTCSYPCYPKTIPFIEEEIFDGMPEITNSGYGIAKRTLIKLGIEYHNQYGMNITNLVPANMYGLHDHFEDNKSHVIPAIIKKFENCNEFVSLWGTGKASREFLYAEDCAKAIALSLEKDTGPDPINLGTGNEITIASLGKLIKTIGNYDANIIWDKTKPDGQPRRCLDTTKAKKILGWTANTSLEVGLKQTINWYRENYV